MGVINHDYNSVSRLCHFCATAMAKDWTLQQVFFFTIENRVYIPYNKNRKEMEYADDFVILWYYYSNYD